MMKSYVFEIKTTTNADFCSFYFVAEDKTDMKPSEIIYHKNPVWRNRINEAQSHETNMLMWKKIYIFRGA